MRNPIVSYLGRVGLMALIPVLGGTGCMRMAVLPTAANHEITMPLSEPRRPSDVPADQSKDPTKLYRVGPRDILRVEVRKDPSLSQDYMVTEEGNVLIPNVGPVKVSDLTTAEIEKKLLDGLSDYIRFNTDAAERVKEVRVGVKEYHSKVIYVVGQVTNPGPKVMRADMMTLQEAIYAAGLPTDNAAIQRTQIITPDPLKPFVQQVDLADILYMGKMQENILLKPNDTVYVPARYGVNLGSAIRELLAPVEQIYDLKYKIEFSKNSNSND